MTSGPDTSGRRRRLSAVLLGAAYVLGLSGLVPARAQAPAIATAWWTSSQVGGVLVGAAALVPPGGVQVANGSDGPVSVGALRLAAAPGTLNAVRLGVAPGSTIETSSIVACPTVEAWEPIHGGALAEAPAWDCTLGQAAAAYDPASSTLRWDFDASFIRNGAIDVVLLPVAGGLPFTVSTQAPADDAIRTTTPASSAPPTTAGSATTAPASGTTVAVSSSTAAPPAPRAFGAGPIDPTPRPTAPAGLPSPLPTTAPTTTVAPTQLAAAADEPPRDPAIARVLALTLAAVLAAGAAAVGTGRFGSSEAERTGGVRGVGRFARERETPPPTI